MTQPSDRNLWLKGAVSSSGVRASVHRQARAGDVKGLRTGDERHQRRDVAMAMSLVTSERGVALLPISIEDYLPPSIVSRRLKGKQPTVDLMVGYHKANASPILKMFLSRLDGSRSAAPGAG